MKGRTPQTCENCGQVRFNMWLLRRYKPEQINSQTIKELRARYEKELEERKT